MDDRLAGPAGDEEINKSGTGDLDTLDLLGVADALGNQLRQFSRRHSRWPGQHQRYIGGKITLRRIFRRGHLDIWFEVRRNLRCLLKLEQSLRDQIVDDLLQKLKPAPGWVKMIGNFTRANRAGPAIFWLARAYFGYFILPLISHAAGNPRHPHRKRHSGRCLRDRFTGWLQRCPA